MKKTALLTLTLLFFTLLASYALAQSRQPTRGQGRESTPLEMAKISDRLYEIVGGSGSRGGMYVGDDGVLVIDAKMDKESVDQTIEKIRSITDRPIVYLVNTHSDGDHVNGNRFYPETVTFVAHENCREDFFHPRRDGAPSEWTSPELAAFIPSLTFRDKMDVFLGSKKVELWYFGVGHTTGDIVVYFPEEKAAFVGDQIFLERAQLIHSYKGGNSFEHVKTLTKMLQTLDAEKFCSGHSEIADRRTIQNHIDQMKDRQQKVKALVAEGKSLVEIKAQFDEGEDRLIEAIHGEVMVSNPRR